MTSALAIDTTSDFLSLALLRTGEPVASHYENCGARMNRTLLGTLDEMLRQAGMTVPDLDVILVARGPGSFTGTRVGLALARSFAQIAGTPLIGVDTLQLLAAQTDPGNLGGRFHALLQCTRNEIYHAPFRWRDGQPEMLQPEMLQSIALHPIDDLHTVVGNEPVVLRRHDGVHGGPDPRLEGLTRAALCHPHPDGARLLAVGMPLYQANPRGPYPPAEPIYLKSAAFRTWKPGPEAP